MASFCCWFKQEGRSINDEDQDIINVCFVGAVSKTLGFNATVFNLQLMLFNFP